MDSPQRLWGWGLRGPELGRFLKKASSVPVFSRSSVRAPSTSLRISLPSLSVDEIAVEFPNRGSGREGMERKFQRLVGRRVSVPRAKAATDNT